MTLGGLTLVAALVWGKPAWLWPAVALIVLFALTLIWGYRGLRGPQSVRTAAAALKAVAVVLLALILLDPLWSGSRARPGENLVLVLVDSSRSMQVRGRDDAKSPAETFAGKLSDERQPWLTRLKQDFDVRRYAFAQRLDPRQDFAALEFDGRTTSLHAALRSLGERFAGRAVAGVLLFSDGGATDAARDGAKLPPIFPVLPPVAAAADDVGLTHVAATQTGFEDAPTTLSAEAAVRGYTGEPLVCRVFDESNKVIQTLEQTPSARDGTASFRFQFRPAKPGLSFYRVHVAAKSELASPAGAPVSREATQANNERLIEVDRGRGPYRILYVGGAPNPEHKFISRALADDPQVELASLLRIARREPKFDFRTRAGETTNPLFRGFDKTNDETERYDQPVFVRLGLKDDRELRDGFPKNAESLFNYHAVVLDDVEAEMFTTDQLSLLARFVSERGGGLLMLGGPDSFEKGGFAKTPLADALPVYLDRIAAAEPPPTGGWRWTLTREGLLEPWLRLRASEPDEARRLATMPPLRTLNRVAGIKPGASLLAAAVDASGTQQPALVVHAYGRGTAIALLIGDLWRWRLQLDPENDDLEKMWRQMFRRLTADVAGRVQATREIVADELTQTIRLTASARDVDYQPLDNAQVSFVVTPPDGKPLTIEAEPSRREPGRYEATYVPRLPGAYRALAKTTDGAGQELPTAETGWTNDPSADEFRRLEPDRKALAELAQQTGGETVELDDLDSFAASLAARPVPETVQTLYPLRHTWWLFTVAVCCLAGEWGLRRWKGMP